MEKERKKKVEQIFGSCRGFCWKLPPKYFEQKTTQNWNEKSDDSHFTLFFLSCALTPKLSITIAIAWIYIELLPRFTFFPPSVLRKTKAYKSHIDCQNKLWNHSWFTNGHTQSVYPNPSDITRQAANEWVICRAHDTDDNDLYPKQINYIVVRQFLGNCNLTIVFFSLVDCCYYCCSNAEIVKQIARNWN